MDEGDGVFVASNDLISKVMERYFNEVMFKVKVSIVDLQPSEAGYAFSLMFGNDTSKLNGKRVSGGKIGKVKAVEVMSDE